LKRVLVDVNVVLDVLLARAPHAAASTACLAVIESRRVEGFLSGHAVTTLAYLVGRARGRAEARKVVQDLCALFTIARVDEAVIQRAIVLSLDDLEDAVTAAAAEAAGCEAILTRDAAGFTDSPVPGVEPKLWLALLETEADGSPESEVHEPQASGRARREVAARRRRPT
jgi:predicted nucleic acid-binding protein